MTAAISALACELAHHIPGESSKQELDGLRGCLRLCLGHVCPLGQIPAAYVPLSRMVYLLEPVAQLQTTGAR